MISGSEKLLLCENIHCGLQQPSAVRHWIVRTLLILLISCSALFFGAFVDSAQAHGMHPNNVSQPTVLTSNIEASIQVASMESVSDIAVKGCGTNCCSMSGCGYVPQRLAEFFLSEISTGLNPGFKILPWVKNPLDSLQRPPRAFA